MRRLNQHTLADIQRSARFQAADVSVGSYDRNAVSPGIVHFGVGNFHRCHQAVYIDRLLSLGHTEWGIVGVSMRSAQIRDSLAPQDFLYSQATLMGRTDGDTGHEIGDEIGHDIGHDIGGERNKIEGSNELRVVASILNILVAPENPQAVISQVADPAIQLVTTTITEKGYYLTSGRIDQNNPLFQQDTLSLSTPSTIYGYLAAALVKRFQTGAPLSIVCCDNVQGGGQHLRDGVETLLGIRDSATLDWAKNNVSFASSMVDRVAPATDTSLIKRVGEILDLEDASPVSAEPFSAWIIEDNFAAVRPALDSVGVIFSKDVTLFEQMKLRLLNAGHSIIAVLGYLTNHDTIHQTLNTPEIRQFCLEILHSVALPITRLPAEILGEAYIVELIQRFENSGVPYRVQQVNTDSSQKIQQRWFPVIDDALAESVDTQGMSLLVAAWVHYIQLAIDKDQLIDPRSDAFSAAVNNKENVEQFLHIAGAKEFAFFSAKPFMQSVAHYYDTIAATGIAAVLTAYLALHTKQPRT